MASVSLGETTMAGVVVVTPVALLVLLLLLLTGAFCLVATADHYQLTAA